MIPFINNACVGIEHKDLQNADAVIMQALFLYILSPWERISMAISIGLVGYRPFSFRSPETSGRGSHCGSIRKRASEPAK
jgi:hypothetical protein